jgi:xylose isomerase
MDVCARGLLAAAAMIEDGGHAAMLAERYAGWDTPAAQAMLTSDLATIAERVDRDGLEPKPRSGRQEKLENWVNRFV